MSPKSIITIEIIKKDKNKTETLFFKTARKTIINNNTVATSFHNLRLLPVYIILPFCI
jgi:hypothetical protein